MYNKYDSFNHHLTSLAQGAWLHPENETNLSRLFFPAVGVPTIDGSFDKYDTAPALTPVETALTSGNSPRRIRQKKTLGSWHCYPHALEIPTSGHGLMQKGSATLLRENHLRTLISAQFASRQAAAVDALEAAVPITSSLGTWTEDTDVISELDSLCKLVTAQTARRPNNLAIGINVWEHIKNHISVTSRMRGISVAASFEDVAAMLLYKGIKLTLLDCYLKDSETEEVKALLPDQVVAFYNEETPSLEDMSFGKEFTLNPDGPEVLSYKEYGGVNEVDTLIWTSDMQVTNAGSCARMAVSVA